METDSLVGKARTRCHPRRCRRVWTGAGAGARHLKELTLMYMRSAVLIRRMMKSQRTAVGEGVQRTLGCSGGGGGRWATWRGGSVSALTALAVLLPEADDTAQTRGALYGAAAEEEKCGGLGQVGVRHHREDHSAAAHRSERE